MMAHNFQDERLERLAYWVRKREEARRNKEAGLPKPWTDDPILQTTRFCNVRRMDDKVSRWLLEEWYPIGLKPDPGTVLAAAGLARLINWPEALADLRQNTKFGPKFIEWNQNRARTHFEWLKGNKLKVFTGAYIINAAGGGNKVDIVLRQINTLWLHPELVRTGSMAETHQLLQRIPGIGSFIAGQIVADLRHVTQGRWSDKDTWAPLGPGSHRGVNWLLGWNGTDKLSRMQQGVFQVYLGDLAAFFRSELKDIFEDLKLEMHDLQNCLCEFDKFMRLSTGTGRAKNKFDGV